MNLRHRRGCGRMCEIMVKPLSLMLLRDRVHNSACERSTSPQNSIAKLNANKLILNYRSEWVQVRAREGAHCQILFCARFFSIFIFILICRVWETFAPNYTFNTRNKAVSNSQMFRIRILVYWMKQKSRIYRTHIVVVPSVDPLLINESHYVNTMSPSIQPSTHIWPRFRCPNDQISCA